MLIAVFKEQITGTFTSESFSIEECPVFIRKADRLKKRSGPDGGTNLAWQITIRPREPKTPSPLHGETELEPQRTNPSPLVPCS